jgi:hypothetical protein
MVGRCLQRRLKQTANDDHAISIIIADDDPLICTPPAGSTPTASRTPSSSRPTPGHGMQANVGMATVYGRALNKAPGSYSLLARHFRLPFAVSR